MFWRISCARSSPVKKNGEFFYCSFAPIAIATSTPRIILPRCALACPAGRALYCPVILLPRVSCRRTSKTLLEPIDLSGSSRGRPVETEHLACASANGAPAVPVILCGTYAGCMSHVAIFTLVLCAGGVDYSRLVLLVVLAIDRYPPGFGLLGRDLLTIITSCARGKNKMFKVRSS